MVTWHIIWFHWQRKGYDTGKRGSHLYLNFCSSWPRRYNNTKPKTKYKPLQYIILQQQIHIAKKCFFKLVSMQFLLDVVLQAMSNTMENIFFLQKKIHFYIKKTFYFIAHKVCSRITFKPILNNHNLLKCRNIVFIYDAHICNNIEKKIMKKYRERYKYFK